MLDSSERRRIVASECRCCLVVRLVLVQILHGFDVREYEESYINRQ